jgi:hypothetical protein
MHGSECHWRIGWIGWFRILGIFRVDAALRTPVDFGYNDT